MTRVTRGKAGKTGKTRDYVRNTNGTFAETPDKPKVRQKVPGASLDQAKAVLDRLPNKVKRKALEAAKRARVPKEVLAPAKEALNSLESKTVPTASAKAAWEVISRLPPRQQRKALEVLKAARTAQATTPVEVKARVRGTDKKPRLPTVRRVVAEEHLRVAEDGKVEVWENSPDHLKAKGGFNMVNRKGDSYEYSVEVEGKRVVINRFSQYATFEGETIRGIPELNPNLRELPNDRLFNRMVHHMSEVEEADLGGSPPRAPMWSKRYHGTVDSDVTVRSRKGIGDYGEMQIHHVNQWSKVPFDSINRKVANGDMSLEEAKATMRANLMVTENKKTGKQEYRIDLATQSSRELVILPGGLHDTNNKALYDANHPMGYHPDTGQLAKFGIPKSNDEHPNSREWFNGFRGRFWAEVSRRQVFILRGEINRRVDNGSLTADDAKRLWREAVRKANGDQDKIRQLRQDAGLKP